MKVTQAALPFLPLCRRLLPARLADLSVTLLKATALELAILAGHVLLYPAGIIQERRGPDRSALPAPEGTAQLPVRAKPPVVLLHGFIDNRSVFVLLRRSLAQHGRQQIESLNYSPLTCDIRIAAELLGRHIEQVCERTGSTRVDVVGHSLGGLIARYYVQRLGGDRRVRTLVTLGTPHPVPGSRRWPTPTPSCGRCARAHRSWRSSPSPPPAAVRTSSRSGATSTTSWIRWRRRASSIRT